MLKFKHSIFHICKKNIFTSNNLLKNNNKPQYDLKESSIISVEDSIYESVKLLKYGKYIKIYLIGTSHKQSLSREMVEKIILETRPNLVLAEVKDSVLMHFEYFINDKYSYSDIISNFGLIGIYKKLRFYFSLKNKNLNGGEFVTAFQTVSRLSYCDIQSIEPNYPKSFSFFFLHFFKDVMNHITAKYPDGEYKDAFKLFKLYFNERAKPNPDPSKLEPYWHSMPILHKCLVEERDIIMAKNIVQTTDLYYHRFMLKKFNVPENLTFVVIVGKGHERGIIDYIKKIFKERDDLLI